MKEDFVKDAQLISFSLLMSLESPSFVIWVPGLTVDRVVVNLKPFDTLSIDGQASRRIHFQVFADDFTLLKMPQLSWPKQI